MIVHVKEPDVEKALKLLNQQNTGLATSEWVVVKRSKQEKSKQGCHGSPLRLTPRWKP